MTPSAQESSRILILSHGAGSSADFLARAFPSWACRCRTRYLEDRTGSVPQILARMRRAAAEASREYDQVFIGGVSIGAHAAAMLAGGPGDPPIHGCVLAMPAWTGQPRPRSATHEAAHEVSAQGPAAVLRRLGTDPETREDWVFDELRRAWADRPGLAAELLAAAEGQGPSAAVLRSVTVPTLIVALRDDPFHPLEVARSWHALIAPSRLEVLQRDEPGAARSVFGARVGAWLSGLSAPR